MKINALLTISRDSNDVMNIRVKDEASNVEFVHVQLSPYNLMMALTGLSYIHVGAEVNGLDVVGKKKIIESRSIICPMQSSDKTLLRDWLAANAQEPGWEVDTYLGSQSSTACTADGTRINYRVFRYESTQ